MVKLGDRVKVLSTFKGQKYIDTIGKYGKVMQLGSTQQGVMIDGDYNNYSKKGLFWYKDNEVQVAATHSKRQVGVMQVKNKLYDTYKKYYFWLECDAKPRDWVYAPKNNGDKVFQLSEVISEDEAKIRQPNLIITKTIKRQASYAESVQAYTEKWMQVTREFKSIDKQEKEKEEMNKVKTGKEIVEKWVALNEFELNRHCKIIKDGIRKNDKVLIKIEEKRKELNDYLGDVLGDDFEQVGFVMTQRHITDETIEAINELKNKEIAINHEITEKANQTILLCALCETYDQRMEVLKTKGIITSGMDIDVFVTADYINGEVPEFRVYNGVSI